MQGEFLFHNAFYRVEAQLLDKINQGIPPELLAQYQVLRTKREAETLSETEYNTLPSSNSAIKSNNWVPNALKPSPNCAKFPSLNSWKSSASSL